MKNNWIAAALLLVFSSCKKEDYRIDGGTHNEQVNSTTFDFIRNHPELSLFGELIEKAGYKDLVNTPNATLFVADNMAVRKYLNRVWVDQVDQTNNQTPYLLSDIPLGKLQDSLRIYIVLNRIERKDLNATGAFYTTQKGDSIKVTLEKRYNDPVAAWEGGYVYSNYMSTTPEFIYIRRRIGLNWDDPAATGIPPAEKDKYEVIKSSGIKTTTGMVHVIGGARDSFYDKSEAHTLFFRPGRDKPQR